MKIIKLRLKDKFKYKRKVIIKNLILNIFIGIHDFEKTIEQCLYIFCWGKVCISLQTNKKEENNYMFRFTHTVTYYLT